MNELSKAVGFGKPPQHSKFQPGKSGNPSGRPKGSRNFVSDLREELNAVVAVQGRTITKQRAMVNSLVANAIDGDAKSIAILLAHFLKKDDVDQGVDSVEDREIAATFATRSNGKKGELGGSNE